MFRQCRPIKLASDGDVGGRGAAVTGGSGECNNADVVLELFVHIWDSNRAGGEAPKTLIFVCSRRVVLVMLVLGGAGAGNLWSFEVEEGGPEWWEGDKAAFGGRDCPTRHLLSPYIVFAADMYAHVIIQRQSDSPAQHFACCRLSYVGHSLEPVESKDEVVVVGKYVKAINTRGEPM